jgi:hypothetical protein
MTEMTEKLSSRFSSLESTDSMYQDQTNGDSPERIPSEVDNCDENDSGHSSDEPDGLLRNGHATGEVYHDDGGPPPWAPSVATSGSNTWSWRDFMYFVGPGWFVSIAYVDPGNYQADIQAGATTGYRLLWTIFWTSIFSVNIIAASSV